jgi:hypothetical protein
MQHLSRLGICGVLAQASWAATRPGLGAEPATAPAPGPALEDATKNERAATPEQIAFWPGGSSRRACASSRSPQAAGTTTAT